MQNTIIESLLEVRNALYDRWLEEEEKVGRATPNSNKNGITGKELISNFHMSLVSHVHRVYDLIPNEAKTLVWDAIKMAANEGDIDPLPPMGDTQAVAKWVATAATMGWGNVVLELIADTIDIPSTYDDLELDV